VTLWNTKTRTRVGRPLLTGRTEVSNHLAFSPDGRLLATGGEAGRVILWDVATRQRMDLAIKGQTDPIYDVAFSPGDRLASTGLNRTVVIWDTSTRRPLGEPLRGESSQGSRVAFSPDGNVLASGASDVTLWDQLAWETNLSAIARAFCSEAGRNLTPSEWNDFLTFEPYLRTCPAPWHLVVSPSVEAVLKQLPLRAVAGLEPIIRGALVEDPHRVGHTLHGEREGLWGIRRGQYLVV
jgi:hypothetical protein